MKAASISAFCTILLAAPAYCQIHPNSGDVPSAGDARAEVFGGFSLAGGSPIGASYGFNGGADFRVTGRIFVAADVSRLTDPPQPSNKMSDMLILFGPRYLVRVNRSSRASVFGEFLMGTDSFHNNGQAYTYSYNSATTFALAGEGGLDYALSHNLSARFEGGYIHGTLKNSTYGGPPIPPSAANNRGSLMLDMVYRF